MRIAGTTTTTLVKIIGPTKGVPLCTICRALLDVSDTSDMTAVWDVSNDFLHWGKEIICSFNSNM